MQLPFTVEQFLGVFNAYNTAVWPVQVVLNALGLLAISLCVFSNSRSRAISAIVGILWAWGGIVYHLTFFSAVNPAAVVFGIGYIIQACLFLYYGTVRDGLRFGVGRNWQTYAGAAFLLYALLIYPVLGYFSGHRYPLAPTFGAPCPTTIFTFGLLLWTTSRVRWYIWLLPLIWSMIGFTAALQLGIREDFGLLVAGVGGSILLLRKRPGLHFPPQDFVATMASSHITRM